MNLRRRRNKPASKIDWSLFTFGKTRDVVDREIDASPSKLARWFDEAREAVRLFAFHREGGRCAKCAKILYLRHDDPFRIANAHEVVPKSAGGDPLDVRNVVCLCSECHLIGAHRQGSEAKWFTIEFKNPLAGALGKFVFKPWAGKWAA